MSTTRVILDRGETHVINEVPNSELQRQIQELTRLVAELLTRVGTLEKLLDDSDQTGQSPEE